MCNFCIHFESMYMYVLIEVCVIFLPLIISYAFRVWREWIIENDTFTGMHFVMGQECSVGDREVKACIIVLPALIILRTFLSSESGVLCSKFISRLQRHVRTYYLAPCAGARSGWVYIPVLKLVPAIISRGLV